MTRPLWLALSLFLLVPCCFAPAQTNPSPKSPAAAAVPSAAQVLTVMNRAADYQLAEQAKTKFSNGWIRAAFYTGVMALYDAGHDQKYLNAATKWAEAANWTLPRGKDPRFADNQAAAQVYCELFAIHPDPKRIAASRAVFDEQIATPKPGRKEWWWCDSLFMAPPAFVRMSRATGDEKYDRFMNEMFWDSADFLFDKDEDLFYRDASFFPPRKTRNGKKIFWSRGNGWVMAGVARVLDVMPPDAPERQRFVELHRRMSAKLITLQGADGLWRSSLIDPEEFPTPETSGTAFFCYALAWGVNHGTLDRATYLPHVVKAWDALAAKVTPEGRLGYVQKVAGAPGKVRPEDTHEYAVGGLLLAGREMVRLAK